jgi:hypothetical protein
LEKKNTEIFDGLVWRDGHGKNSKNKNALVLIIPSIEKHLNLCINKVSKYIKIYKLV